MVRPKTVMMGLQEGGQRKRPVTCDLIVHALDRSVDQGDSHEEAHGRPGLPPGDLVHLVVEGERLARRRSAREALEQVHEDGLDARDVDAEEDEGTDGNPGKEEC